MSPVLIEATHGARASGRWRSEKCDHHRLVAQKRIVVARSDGIHDLLDLFCYGRVAASAEGSEPVPAGVTACASLGGAGSRSTALAPIIRLAATYFGTSLRTIDGGYRRHFMSSLLELGIVVRDTPRALAQTL